MQLNVGDPAPDFTLPDQNGKTHTLSDYVGNWVLIFFYPRDDTPGCTTEACTLRDNFPRFEALDATIFGVSTDTVKSHSKFAGKYHLPFTLLADVDKTAHASYDAWGTKKFMGREYQGTHRISYLVDPSGKIAKIYGKVKPAAHAEEVLADLQELRQ
jgi:thioredoxin-dependent peroxiredoxin